MKQLILLGLCLIINHSFSLDCENKNLIKSCKCVYSDSANPSMKYELTKAYGDDVRFKTRFLTGTTNCSHHGNQVNCSMKRMYRGGSSRNILSIVRGTQVLNSSWFYLPPSFTKCDCEWKNFQPVVYEMNLKPNSLRELQVQWSYFAWNGNVVKQLNIKSQLCIKKAGQSECNITKCRSFDRSMSKVCSDIRINELDYNQPYDICVQSEASLFCRNKIHNTCLYNQSLAQFYYRRFGVVNVTCEFDVQSKYVNLSWVVVDASVKSYEKHRIKYSLHGENDELLTEGNAYGSHVTEVLRGIRGIVKTATLKLCLSKSCSRDYTVSVNILHSTKKQNEMRYIIPASGLGAGVLIFIGILILLIRAKRNSKKVDIEPRQQKVIDENDVIFKITPSPFYEELDTKKSTLNDIEDV